MHSKTDMSVVVSQRIEKIATAIEKIVTIYIQLSPIFLKEMEV